MSNLLRKYLKKNKITQAEMARKLDISECAVSFYLSGRRHPGRKTARRISDLTGIPLIEFFK